VLKQGPWLTPGLCLQGGGQGLWCKWEMLVANNGRWSKLAGAVQDDGRPVCVDAAGKPVLNEYGQTQVCFCAPGSEAVWAHPLDVHYSTTTMHDWPRLVLEVWSQDYGGRNELQGYGVAHVPGAAGVYDLEVPVWRPVAASAAQRRTLSGMVASLRGVFLGAWPRLHGDLNPRGVSEKSAAKDLVHNARSQNPLDANRNTSQLESVGTGTVCLHLSVITRGFQKLGHGSSASIEAQWEEAQREAERREREERGANAPPRR